MGKIHTDREYENDLKKLRERLLKMAGRIEEMISDSVRALVERDVELARRTIDADHLVNRAEVETDELCLVILARRQPVASDLRFVTLALKMVTDLERIGDLAVNIAERAVALSGLRPAPFAAVLSRLAELDQNQLREAIESFVTRDAARAEKVCAQDDQIDKLYWQLAQEAQKDMAHNDASLERGIHVQAAAKFLERIGDHVTNLAELVIFLVRGKDIRHLGKLDDS